ncbi:5'-AMP-activated protein kinase catalytic subunit alpha-2-like [Carassius auratus]|uniref:non-specific serine/threonine protein kinase n=2 Tax=Carassius TaxID=7956 RepID=A0A6P6QEJ8_CARAU|nr:5'-AMP-activated protein kinase catalytic subunit alpha-2-like [Carassius auratus]XP_026131747.1 5'-AMP-activated protein kinase catalytic subunit alpha-2-like [Carassius auratus]
MSKTSVFFTECSEVKREGMDRQEMISLTSDIMYDTVSIEEVTTDKKPVETTTKGSGSVSSDNQGGMKVCPTESVENSPTEKPAKGRKIGAVFRRVWKAVKRPFHCCDQNSVVRLTPQLKQDDSELMPAPSPFRITPTAPTDAPEPELVNLPGQVCEEVELCVPGPSRTEQTLDTDLSDPESSPVADPSSSDLGNEKPKKQRKRKAVHAFFRRFRKAVKHLFPCRDSKRVEDSTPQVALDDSEIKLADETISVEPEPGCQTRSDQVCAALQPSSVQEADQDPATPAVSCVSDSSDLEISMDSGSRVSFFVVGELLGRGSFGLVYEGSHIFSDRIKVAMKYIHKHQADRYLDAPGHSKPVLAEVAMLLRLGQPPLCPNVIKLHDWIENKKSFVLIMEYPEPCHTLHQHIIYSDDTNEKKARWIICQLIQAVKHCIDRGVFHGDIHSGNILVTDPSLKLKLIDFGCAHPLSSEGNLSSEYRGAPFCTPPEVLMHTTFHANPAYVWAVGVVLFEILHGYLPFESQDEILRGYVQTKLTLSSACRDLIFQCLIRNPSNRLTLEHLEEHRWFNN